MDGNGETRDPILDVLREIKTEIQGTNARLGSVEARLESVDGRLQSLEREVRVGFARLDERFENVLRGELGERVRDHEQRLRALEKRRKR